MTDKPTPKEIDDLVYELRQAGTDDTYSIACVVLAKWGTPAPVGVEPVALLVRKNSWRDGQWEAAPPNSPSYGLAWANQRVYVYTAQQHTKAQAGAVKPPLVSARSGRARTCTGRPETCQAQTSTARSGWAARQRPAGPARHRCGGSSDTSGH